MDDHGRHHNWERDAHIPSSSSALECLRWGSSSSSSAARLLSAILAELIDYLHENWGGDGECDPLGKRFGKREDKSVRTIGNEARGKARALWVIAILAQKPKKIPFPLEQSPKASTPRIHTERDTHTHTCKHTQRTIQKKESRARFSTIKTL